MKNKCFIRLATPLLLVCLPAASYAAPSSIVHNLLAQYPTPLLLSPDGNLVLQKIRHENDFEIRIISRGSGKPLAVQRSPNTQLALAFRPGGGAIAYLADTKGDLQFHLYLWDIATNTVTQLPGIATRSASAPLHWSPDGKKIALFCGKTEGVITIANPYTAQPPAIIGEARATTSFAWSPDSTRLAYIPLAHPETIAITRPASASQTLPAGAPGTQISDLAWSPDSSGILATVSSPDKDFFSLYRADLSTSSITPFIPETADIQHPLWLGNTIAYEVNRKGLRELWLADASTGTSTQSGIPSASHHLLGTSENGDFYDDVSPLDAPHYIEALTPSGQHILMASSPPPEQPSQSPEFLFLPRKNGGTIPVFLWGKAANANTPAIIWLHGGPDMEEWPVWDARIQRLVNSGVVYAIVNYSGSLGYGKSYQQNTSLATQAEDLLAVQNYLRTERHIQPGNIIVNTYSHGSQVAAKALQAAPGAFGWLVLQSTIGLNKTDCPAATHLKGIYEFHGAHDPLSPPQPALNSLQDCLGPLAGSAILDEGHYFHKTSSMARIDHLLEALKPGVKQLPQP